MPHSPIGASGSPMSRPATRNASERRGLSTICREFLAIVLSRPSQGSDDGPGSWIGFVHPSRPIGRANLIDGATNPGDRRPQRRAGTSDMASTQACSKSARSSPNSLRAKAICRPFSATPHRPSPPNTTIPRCAGSWRATWMSATSIEHAHPRCDNRYRSAGLAMPLIS